MDESRADRAPKLHPIDDSRRWWWRPLVDGARRSRGGAAAQPRPGPPESPHQRRRGQLQSSPRQRRQSTTAKPLDPRTEDGRPAPVRVVEFQRGTRSAVAPAFTSPPRPAIHDASLLLDIMHASICSGTQFRSTAARQINGASLHVFHTLNDYPQAERPEQDHRRPAGLSRRRDRAARYHLHCAARRRVPRLSVARALQSGVLQEARRRGNARMGIGEASSAAVREGPCLTSTDLPCRRDCRSRGTEDVGSPSDRQPHRTAQIVQPEQSHECP